MIDFGTVRPGTTLYIPFATYDSNDPSASVTLTGLATTDIEVYKNGSVTQRSSDSGYALLDTDGIDFDSVTGIHGFSIDLADNTDVGFYVAGAQYTVVVASITVDAATVNFIAATFRIGYPDAVINTTIATLASQTSFTLTAGPAEDDALNGCVVAIHDVASAVQVGFAVVSDYTGSTKTVALTAGVTFTAAAGDNIAVYPPSNAAWGGAVAYTATRGLAGTALPNAAADAAGGLPISDAGGLDLDTQLGKLVGTLATGTHNPQSGDAYARLGAPAGASVSADIAAAKADTAAILADTGTDGVVVASGSKSGYSLSATQTFDLTGSITGNLSGSVGSVTGNVGGSVASVTAITASGGVVSADVKKINAVTITGDGSATPFDVA